MTRNCPTCGGEVEGVDLGDHPDYLEFDCECGHSWGEQCEPECPPNHEDE